MKANNGQLSSHKLPVLQALFSLTSNSSWDKLSSIWGNSTVKIKPNWFLPGLITACSLGMQSRRIDSAVPRETSLTQRTEDSLITDIILVNKYRHVSAYFLDFFLASRSNQGWWADLMNSDAPKFKFSHDHRRTIHTFCCLFKSAISHVSKTIRD